MFPFRLAALDVYAPPPPEGEALSCNAAIRLEGEQLVSPPTSTCSTRPVAADAPPGLGGQAL